MGSLDASTWAALAAFCSAFASFMIWRIHRRNLIESLRPEMVLTHWSRNATNTQKSGFEAIRFSAILNVGRGTGFDIHWQSDSHGEQSIARMPMKQIPILAPNEPISVQGEIFVSWQNVPPTVPSIGKIMLLGVEVFSFAGNGRRYRTQYTLAAMERPNRHSSSSGELLAPGLYLINRKTTSVRTWWPRMKCRAEAACQLATKLWNRMQQHKKYSRNRAKRSS